MKNRMGIVVLILICVVLGVVLIWTQKQAAEERTSHVETIVNYSNRVTTAETNLKQEQQVRAALEGDLTKQKEVLTNLNKTVTQISNNLEKSETALKTAEAQLVQRDARINELEAQNQMLDARALELSMSITNLNSQIDDTDRKSVV